MSVEIHEASHCAMAILLNRPVDHTWRTVGSTLAGETKGHARIPIRSRIEPSQLPIILAGYISVGRENWPPPFEEACEEEREGLGIVLRHLAATKEKYDRTVQFTRELMANEHFILLRDAIARALAVVPHLDREAIEDLCRAHDFPIPEPEGVPV